MEANKAECSRGGTANKAMLQGRKKKKLKSETTRRHGTEWEALQSLLIVVCCQMRLTLSSVSSQAAMEQFSLQWQPGSFSFLLSFSLMQFQSSKQTRHVLSSGSSIPWKMTGAACTAAGRSTFSIAGQSLTLDLCQGSKQSTLLPVRPVAPRWLCSVGNTLQ